MKIHIAVKKKGHKNVMCYIICFQTHNLMLGLKEESFFLVQVSF